MQLLVWYKVRGEVPIRDSGSKFYLDSTTVGRHRSVYHITNQNCTFYNSTGFVYSYNSSHVRIFRQLGRLLLIIKYRNILLNLVRYILMPPSLLTCCSHTDIIVRYQIFSACFHTKSPGVSFNLPPDYAAYRDNKELNELLVHEDSFLRDDG